MDVGCKGMDKICIWLEKLLLWVDRCGPPPIMWVGQAGSRFHNPPAPHIEIVYVLEGSCPKLRIGDRKTSLQTGELSLHSVHFGNESPPNPGLNAWCLFLNVDGEKEFSELRQTPLVCGMRVIQRDEVAAAFATLAARCYRYGTGPEKLYRDPRPLFLPERAAANVPAVLVKNSLLDLLAILLEDSRQSGASAAGALPVPVVKAMEFMAVNSNDPSTTLEDVAQVAGLSVDHFGRLFRQQAGITPMRWLQKLRIQQSRFLLERTSLFIEEVAVQVGFSDPFHFSRIFKSFIGVSPTEYRRERESSTSANPRTKN